MPSEIHCKQGCQTENFVPFAICRTMILIHIQPYSQYVLSRKYCTPVTSPLSSSPTQWRIIQAWPVVEEKGPLPRPNRTCKSTSNRNPQWTDILPITRVCRRTAGEVLTASLRWIVRTELEGSAVLSIETSNAASLLGCVRCLD